MTQAILVAMLAYIDDLQRAADLNDTFADDVVALAESVQTGQNRSYAHAAMLDLARGHRVDAIKARAKMDVITDQFVRRFGVERFEQERSKRSARPRRPI